MCPPLPNTMCGGGLSKPIRSQSCLHFPLHFHPHFISPRDKKFIFFRKNENNPVNLLWIRILTSLCLISLLIFTTLPLEVTFNLFLNTDCVFLKQYRYLKAHRYNKFCGAVCIQAAPVREFITTNVKCPYLGPRVLPQHVGHLRYVQSRPGYCGRQPPGGRGFSDFRSRNTKLFAFKGALCACKLSFFLKFATCSESKLLVATFKYRHRFRIHTGTF